ncbi:MAG TPA: SRPBCC family protein, partial [bacterium]|nr:SRPBCC family protein [bacterium]
MKLKDLVGLSTPGARLVVLPAAMVVLALAGPDGVHRVPSPCLIRRVFGRCPTCGVTRAMAALLRGDVRRRRRRGLGAAVLVVLFGQLLADARRVLSRGPVRTEVMTPVAARPEEVWADVRDIASHVEWMQDAEAIRFTSPSKEGVGTTFRCQTRVGPFRFADPMEVTEWSEGRAIAIRHEGLVKGTGRFALEPAADGGTLFRWSEELCFPWYLGGTLGAAAASEVMRLVW